MPCSAFSLENVGAWQPLRIAAAALQVHWVRPEVAVEVTYLTWTEDNSRAKFLTRASGGTTGEEGCEAAAAFPFALTAFLGAPIQVGSLRLKVVSIAK